MDSPSPPSVTAAEATASTTANLNTITSLAYSNFTDSIKSETTKERYVYCLNRYLKFLGYPNGDRIDVLIEPQQQPKVIESNIIRYIIWLKQDQKLAGITINLYLAAIKHFYAMNDIVLNRKKISMYVGDNIRTNKDRGYTTEEIQRLLEFCDERAKALVLLLASTGIRIGAIPNLQIKHLKKIPLEYNNLYQITIYEGTKEEHFTFTTPEAAAAIDVYLDYRVRAGEKLVGNSPLIRKEFDVCDVRRPEKIQDSALSKLLGDKLHKSGVMATFKETERMKHGQKRNPIARAHGFRKFATTNMVRAKVSAEAREMLLGHSIGLNKAYYRPGEDEILQEYLKAVDLLTINEENRLKTENIKLKNETSKIDQLQNQIDKLTHSMYGLLHVSKKPSKEIETEVSDVLDIELDGSKY
jgi:integrase